MGEDIPHILVDALRHAVVQQLDHRGQFNQGKILPRRLQAVMNPPFHPQHRDQPAIVKDVRRLGGPGRDGPFARGHEDARVTHERIAGAQ